ncbi:MAG: hypothetical protein JNJ59_03370 [Deltaproteobacteria bacterium]|nr:hypothetical protein [Deltaproteobacteria bacterium]
MRRSLAAVMGTVAAIAVVPARAAGPSDVEDGRPGRIGAEVGLGLLGGTAGFFTGGLLGYGICGLGGGGDREWGCLAPALLGAHLGAFAGISMGVYGGGELAGGDGALGWTFLGSTAGLVTAGTILWAAEVDPGSLTWWLVGVGLPLAGGIVGYELTVEGEPREVQAALSFPF